MGGLARRAALISQERDKTPFLLLLDGGDALFSDQPLTEQSKGALIIEAMNLMGYDAMALGEGDLRLGQSTLQRRMEEATFPILSANVRLSESGDLFAPAYAFLELDGRSVGIIGLTGLASEPVPEFEISDPLTAARQVVPEVTEQADTVIILSHLGWARNADLAGLFSAVDLIIGGGAQAPGQQPYRADVTGTYVAQAELPRPGRAGRVVGRWALTLDADGNTVSQEWRAVSLGPEFADDPAMAAVLQEYAVQ